MVVLAASIVTRGGKPVISRQFLEMPRSRIEGLLASFPKLIPAGSQHTTIETADVRFVYQPMEDLYVLVITNKGSNILQDISTLSLITRSISDLLRSSSPDEATILHHAFDLIAAFDEIISLGYRENVTVQQVRSVLEAESHEEKIQEIIARNKEAEAKEELKRRAKQLEMQRRETAKLNHGAGRNTGGFGNGSSGYGGGGGMAGGYTPVQQQRFEAPAAASRSQSPAMSSKPAFKGAGMKLGKKPKQSDVLDALGSEAVVQYEEAAPYVPEPVYEPEVPDVDVLEKVDQESVHVSITEHLSLTLLRDGGLKSLDLKGELELFVQDASLAKLRLNLQSPDASADFASDVQFKQHPQVAKFASGPAAKRVVALKDSNRDFPVGKGLAVVKWKLGSTNEAIVPLAINCWPSPSTDGCDVNIEFELEAKHLTLRNVVISIPLPPNSYPKVSSNTGEWTVNSITNCLDWTTDSIDADEPSGTLEFSVSGTEDPDTFFPVGVRFVSAGSLAEVKVDSATLVESGEEVTFSQETVLVTDEYIVI
ncbi:hypothetical protein BDY24DRAFT_205327 [Mrakia frigida]|uniref:coatomer subunit delta n=1 Tax=Mrakia frigida TaxID=29902 RepID=UPI003FCBF875